MVIPALATAVVMLIAASVLKAKSRCRSAMIGLPNGIAMNPSAAMRSRCSRSASP